MKRLTIALVAALSACAAELQQPPLLVGQHEGRPLYAMRGFTSPGITTVEEMRPRVAGMMPVFCRRGDPKLVNLVLQDGNRPMGSQVGWNATFTCDRLGG